MSSKYDVYWQNKLDEIFQLLMVSGVILVLVLRKDMKYAIPFGPFLSLAGLIYLFFGRYLIHWYAGLLY